MSSQPRLLSAPHATTRAADGPFAAFLAVELLIWGSLYGVYLIVRGSTIAGFGEALGNARRVIEVERLTGLDHEALVQDATRAVGGLEDVLARYYELGFFPVVIAGLLFLAYRDRARYREIRTAMLVAIGAATVVFALLPTAPPRLVPGLGLEDTVGMNAHDTGSLHGLPYNPYAAMPSMHVGWTLLLAIGLFAASSGLLARIVIAAHPAVMTVAVVATGNHYLLDALVGATIALAALALVRHHGRPAPDEPAPAPRSRPPMHPRPHWPMA